MIIEVHGKFYLISLLKNMEKHCRLKAISRKMSSLWLTGLLKEFVLRGQILTFAFRRRKLLESKQIKPIKIDDNIIYSNILNVRTSHYTTNYFDINGNALHYNDFIRAFDNEIKFPFIIYCGILSAIHQNWRLYQANSWCRWQLLWFDLLHFL